VVPSTLKRLTAASLAAALALTLSACGKGGSTESSDNTAGGGSTATLKLWTRAAADERQLGVIKQVVSDYNASQDKYQVELQSFPQDSYNQSVAAAAASNSLPCILEVDGPNVPNWAWGGYLTPLEGLDETLSKFLPSTVGIYNGKTYGAGYYDEALAMYARKSALEQNNIRIPTIDQPWTAGEFTAALATLKATGQWTNPLDMNTGGTGEWLPYAYSPLLQSFGGDLIDRTEYKNADGVLNGADALAWATWFRGLVDQGYMPAKSGADAEADFLNGKSALLYNGSWGADKARTALGDDIVFLPPPDFGAGTKIGGGSWEWALGKGCPSPEGAQDYLKFALQDKYVAAIQANGTVPATDAAAAMVKGYEAGGVNDVFRQLSKNFAMVRPVTPGYPFIATTFAKAAQDIANGADPQQTLDQAVSEIDANQQSNNYFQ